MHYTLFISVFRRNKVTWYLNYLNFPCIRVFELIYDNFQVWLISSRYSFSTFAFIFDVNIFMKFTYSYWFVIIKAPVICNYFSRGYFNYFVFLLFSRLPVTCINIFYACWFTIIVGCICFKKTHNSVFNATNCLRCLEYS